MSTFPQYTLQSQDVYTFTINTLDTLPLDMPGGMESRDLLRVLVFAAASRLSVHQACDQLDRAPSGPTVLGNLASQFDDLDALEGHVNDLLARLIPQGSGQRGRHSTLTVTSFETEVRRSFCEQVHRKAVMVVTVIVRVGRYICK